MVGLRFSSRLTQGPAVRLADRHHSLRLDMLTKTRSAFMQVRCAVVALWSEHEEAYATWIRPATTKLDSFLPTSSAPASLAEITDPDPPEPSPLDVVGHCRIRAASEGCVRSCPRAGSWRGVGGLPLVVGVGGGR